MVLIADNHAAQVLEPGVHALKLPAPFVPQQRPPVLVSAVLLTVERDERDAVRGTWQTDPHKGGTRYLWAGYRYQPPQIGFWVDPPGAAGLGVYGAATGTNRLGQYYCWNRTCDINLGRWTTPDPVATPWWNISTYILSHVLLRTDASGLDPYDMGDLYYKQWQQRVKECCKGRAKCAAVGGRIVQHL